MTVEQILHLGLPFFLAVSFGFIIEALVEHVLGKPLELFAPEWKGNQLVLTLVPMLVGVGFCFVYQIDLIKALADVAMEAGIASGGLVITQTTFGLVVSGLLIGRFSSLFHQWIVKYIPSISKG